MCYMRENQAIIRLPDIQQMQCEVKINESHVNGIKSGRPVRIELEADPDNPLKGKVKEVVPFPFPLRGQGALLEYGPVVTIIDPPSTIRSGLRAKVKITFEA